jgi:hypothetical protein
MPYRSLKRADLKPRSTSNLRTIPRPALMLTVAAQVVVGGMLVVASFLFWRPFQTAAEAYEMALSPPILLLVRCAELVREQVWWVLAALLVLLGLEVRYFVRQRPFTIPRFAWATLMLCSLGLPFGLLLIGGMLLLQAWAELLAGLH